MGGKNAVLDEMELVVVLSTESRKALEKLNIRELLQLTKDLKESNKQYKTTA